MWTWDRNTDHTVGEILEDGRKVYMVRDTDTIYSSNKAGITLYVSGSVNDNPEGGLNQSDSHAITFRIPDASNVVFTKDFTVNGYFRMNTGWSDGCKECSVRPQHFQRHLDSEWRLLCRQSHAGWLHLQRL